MRKTKHLLLLILILLFSFCNATATPQVKIKVNNKIISSDVEPFIKNGTTYVPIRTISKALNVDKIIWNETAKTVTINKGSKKISLIINKNYAYINNTYTSLTASPLIYNNRTFVPLRFISNCFDADVNWNQDLYTVSITTNSSSSTSTKPTNSSTVSKPSSNTTTKPATSTTTTKPSTPTTTPTNKYTTDDVYWLSRIIEAEAAGESFKGKVAVGEVILNRVKSSDFPNTIWGVIFDKNYGVQFEPVANGSIYNTPSDESINAAKTALNGSNYVGNSLYFLNPTIAESKWIINNRKFFLTIGNHDFYL